MLNGIPANLSPDLVRILMMMGHSDAIVIGDANFPLHVVSRQQRSRRFVRADGLGIPDLLESILTLMPLDPYVDAPVTLMQTVPGDSEPPVWKTYQRIIAAHRKGANPGDIAGVSGGGDALPSEKELGIQHVERFAFYDLCASSFAALVTGETALYGNIILQKGVVVPQ